MHIPPRTHTHLCNLFIYLFFYILPNTEIALYFPCVFFLVLAEKLLFLISMTTSKQGSGLDTALPAGFLPCDVQHARKHTNKLFTNKAELWQAGRERESCDAAVGAAVVIVSDVFHFVWQTSLHSVSVSIPHINITD